MQAIIKVLAFLIGLFVIANGVFLVLMPPFGDEPQGYAIIAVGIVIPIITMYVSRIDDRAEA